MASTQSSFIHLYLFAFTFPSFLNSLLTSLCGQFWFHACILKVHWAKISGFDMFPLRYQLCLPEAFSISIVFKPLPSCRGQRVLENPILLKPQNCNKAILTQVKLMTPYVLLWHCFDTGSTSKKKKKLIKTALKSWSFNLKQSIFVVRLHSLDWKTPDAEVCQIWWQYNLVYTIFNRCLTPLRRRSKYRNPQYTNLSDICKN